MGLAVLVPGNPWALAWRRLQAREPRASPAPAQESQALGCQGCIVSPDHAPSWAFTTHTGQWEQWVVHLPQRQSCGPTLCFFPLTACSFYFLGLRTFLEDAQGHFMLTLECLPVFS